MLKKITYTSTIIIIIDQLIKYLISNKIELNESIEIINHFFSIAYVQNIGAAWNILSGNRWLLIIIGIISLVGIYFYFIKDKKLKKIEVITYSILIGGTIGNLIDRIVYGYVIDYLSFNIFGYHFPVFNLADICIVVSVFLMIMIEIKGSEEKHEN